MCLCQVVGSVSPQEVDRCRLHIEILIAEVTVSSTVGCCQGSHVCSHKENRKISRIAVDCGCVPCLRYTWLVREEVVAHMVAVVDALGEAVHQAGTMPDSLL